MAFIVKVVERKNRLKNNAMYQHAVQVNLGMVETREVAQELQDFTSLSRGDVMSVLEHLGDVVARYNARGLSVKLGNLGTFTPRIKSKAIPAGEEYDASALVTAVNMRFTPSVNVKSNLQKTRIVCQKADGTCPAPSTGGGSTGGEGEGTGGTPSL